MNLAVLVFPAKRHSTGIASPSLGIYTQVPQGKIICMYTSLLLGLLTCILPSTLDTLLSFVYVSVRAINSPRKRGR